MKFFKILSLIILFNYVSIDIIWSQTNNEINLESSQNQLIKYQDYLKSEISQNKIPGVVSLVMKNGEIIQESAFGFSNSESKRPLESDDIFYIQSMTKPIITVAFMMLYEEGYFKLSDPVSKYLPEISELKVSQNIDEGINGATVSLNNEITIYNLLTHTAGLSHGIGPSKLDKDIWENQYLQTYTTIQDRVDNLFSLPLMGQPDAQWNYSPTPDIISILIEQFSGKNTNDFLTERIFKPLEMNDTGYNLSESKNSRFVHLSEKNEKGQFMNSKNQVKMQGNSIWSGVNALFSTAPDYLKFCQMLLNGGVLNGNRLLKQKTIDLMTSNQVNNLFEMLPGHGFGYGFAITTNVAETNSVGSEGLYFWCGLYNTHFFIDPKEKIIAIYMTQIEPFSFKPNFTMRKFIYSNN